MWEFENFSNNDLGDLVICPCCGVVLKYETLKMNRKYDDTGELMYITCPVCGNKGDKE